MKMTRKAVITKEVIGKELYLYINGKLFFKRWINYDYSKTFHDGEGLTQWAR